jgi:hypothetical protein
MIRPPLGHDCKHFDGVGVRKVRTAQATVLDNLKAEQSDGKCNRKIPLGEVVSCQLLVVGKGKTNDEWSVTGGAFSSRSIHHSSPQRAD